jgi:hypothetical protein
MLAACRLGDDPAVLLVHGWEDDNSLRAPLIDVLVARERSVVVFDRPAHGPSEGEWGIGPRRPTALLPWRRPSGRSTRWWLTRSERGGVILAMSEGLVVDRIVLIAPPVGTSNRWLRYADRLGVSEEGRTQCPIDLREVHRCSPRVVRLSSRAHRPECRPVGDPLRRRRAHGDQRLARSCTQLSAGRSRRRRRTESLPNGSRSGGCRRIAGSVTDGPC